LDIKIHLPWIFTLF